jgi:RNase P/RNase MRP subunit POP5
MVRFKKRYFVVQLDRERDIFDPAVSSEKKKQFYKPRAYQDSKPLDIPDRLLANAVKDLVQKIHGDFGRAAITTGLRTIYCNPETHLVLIQCRHGPHRLVASCLPFFTKVKEEKVVPRLIYTGATIKHCFKVLKKSGHP